MNDFTFYTAETAPLESKEILESIGSKYGFVPNLFAYMAEASKTLEAYLALNSLIEKTSLTPAQQQLALLSASTENECEFCTVAHRAFAKVKGANVQSIEAIHTQGDVIDPSDDALNTLVTLIVKKRGQISNEEIGDFINAGFTKQQVLELILIVSIKTLSNYINHITHPVPNKELLSML